MTDQQMFWVWSMRSPAILIDADSRDRAAALYAGMHRQAESVYVCSPEDVGKFYSQVSVESATEPAATHA